MKTRSSGRATFLDFREEIRLSKKNRVLVHEAKMFSTTKEEWDEASRCYKRIAPKMHNRNLGIELDADVRYALRSTLPNEQLYSECCRIISLYEACNLFEPLDEQVKKRDQEEKEGKRSEKKSRENKKRKQAFVEEDINIDHPSSSKTTFQFQKTNAERFHFHFQKTNQTKPTNQGN